MLFNSHKAIQVRVCYSIQEMHSHQRSKQWISHDEGGQLYDSRTITDANAGAVLADLHTTSQIDRGYHHACTSDTWWPVIIHQIREGNKHDSILIIGLDGVVLWQDKLASSVRNSGASLPFKSATVTRTTSRAGDAVAESLVRAGSSAFFLLNSWTTCDNQSHLECMMVFIEQLFKLSSTLLPHQEMNCKAIRTIQKHSESTSDKPTTQRYFCSN